MRERHAHRRGTLRRIGRRREIWWLLGACAAGIAIRLAYVLITQDHVLAGDEVEYDTEGRLAEAGRWLHTTCCWGVEHVSLQKAPGYPLWVSALYTVLGPDPDRVLAVQALLSPVTVVLAFLLGRRLFGVRVGLVAAWVVALGPGTWQYETRLYSEALATPLTLAVLLAVLGATDVTWRRAAGVGALIGVTLLVRPSSLLLLAPAAVAWWALAGARGGTARLAVTVAVAVLCVVPWTVRNYAVDDAAVVPIAIQTAAGYGTFNAEAANDPDLPYKWRPGPPGIAELLAGPPLSDAALYAELLRRTRTYVRAHPESVPAAFFWNGITRTWDLRRPRWILDQVRFEGRTREVAAVAMVAWWVVLAGALAGLVLAWRRGRRALVLAVAALCLATSVVFASDGGTRYRAPLEPLFVVLAASAVSAAMTSRTHRASV